MAVISIVSSFASGLGAPAHAGVVKGTPAVVFYLPLVSAGSDVGETSFGALTADSVRFSSGADIAVIAADEFLPKSFAAGKHTVFELLGALRNTEDASDTIVVLKVTGQQLIDAANRSVSHEPVAFPGFLQVSGMQIVYSVGDGPKAHVLSAAGQNANVAGGPQPGNGVRADGRQPESPSISVEGSLATGKNSVPTTVNPDQTYTVATTASLAYGCLGYFRVWSPADIVRRTGITLYQSLTQYFAANPVPDMLTGGRIVQEE